MNVSLLWSAVVRLTPRCSLADSNSSVVALDVLDIHCSIQ